MATTEEKLAIEDQLLRDNEFDPRNLSEQERADALAMIHEQEEKKKKDDEEAKKAAQSQSTGSQRYPKGSKFFRSTVPGLSVLTGPPKDGEVQPERVRFAPFQERDEEGEKIKAGYLASNDPDVIKRLEKDPSVVTIDEEEFQKRTDYKNEHVKPLPY